MKHRFILVAIAAVLFGAVPASAQFGLMGGFTSSSASIKANGFKPEAVSLYHAGITYKVNLGAGFAVQPSLLYQVKGASLDKIAKNSNGDDEKFTLDTKTGYLEGNLGVQWGPDLIAICPYIFLEPFVGYALMNEESAKGNEAGLAELIDSESFETGKVKDWKNSAKQRLEYGFGVGGGIEFSHIQISVQYFMNLGPLYNSDGKVNSNDILEAVKTSFGEKKNYQGLKVSLAILF